MIPGLRRSPGEEKGYPLQCSGLKNSMDCIIHGVSKVSDVTERLSVHFTNIAYSIFHYLRQNSTKKKCNIMVINIYEMCNKLKKNDILQSDSNKNLIALFSFWDFPGGSDSKASVYNVRDLGSIPGLGRSPGEGNGNPLQYHCLENPLPGLHTSPFLKN